MRRWLRRWLRWLERWIVALAAEERWPQAQPLPDDWPTEWPTRAHPQYWARGWGVYPQACRCGYEWVAVACAGTRGVSRCPCCGKEVTVAWGSDRDEMPNDGVWL